jgi:hypothetical protein
MHVGQSSLRNGGSGSDSVNSNERVELQCWKPSK